MKKADADRLHARTLEMIELAFQRMADGQQRKATAAVLAQGSRARVRASMWLVQSRRPVAPTELVDHVWTRPQVE